MQAVFGKELGTETSDAGAFSDWALAYVAAAAGCRVWDNNGDPHLLDSLPETLPGLPAAFRNSRAMRQYIVVGGDVMRLLDDGNGPKQLSMLSAPCDFIFTNVKSIGIRLPNSGFEMIPLILSKRELMSSEMILSPRPGRPARP